MLPRSFAGVGRRLSFLLAERVSPVSGVLGRAGKAEKPHGIVSSWDFQALRWGGCSSPRYPGLGSGGWPWASTARGDPWAELLSSVEQRALVVASPCTHLRPAPVLRGARAHLGGWGSPRLFPTSPWLCARCPSVLLGEHQNTECRFLVGKDLGQASPGQTLHQDMARTRLLVCVGASVGFWPWQIPWIFLPPACAAQIPLLDGVSNHPAPTLGSLDLFKFGNVGALVGLCSVTPSLISHLGPAPLAPSTHWVVGSHAGEDGPQTLPQLETKG